MLFTAQMAELKVNAGVSKMDVGVKKEDPCKRDKKTLGLEIHQPAVMKNLSEKLTERRKFVVSIICHCSPL